MRFVALAAGLMMIGSVAQAAVTEAGHTLSASIDFRTWNGADGQQSWSQDGVTAHALKYRSSHRLTRQYLHQDATDGLGVKWHPYSSDDEIGGREVLYVSFDHARAITGVLLSDLYDRPDGGRDGEEALVKVFLDDGNWFKATAFGNHADQHNGEATLNFASHLGGRLVTALKFYATNEWNDEYSIAGLSEVPLPAAAWLLGAGVIGLGAMRRRRQAKA